MTTTFTTKPYRGPALDANFVLLPTHVVTDDMPVVGTLPGGPLCGRALVAVTPGQAPTHAGVPSDALRCDIRGRQLIMAAPFVVAGCFAVDFDRRPTHVRKSLIDRRPCWHITFRGPAGVAIAVLTIAADSITLECDTAAPGVTTTRVRCINTKGDLFAALRWAAEQCSAVAALTVFAPLEVTRDN